MFNTMPLIIVTDCTTQKFVGGVINADQTDNKTYIRGLCVFSTTKEKGRY